MRRLTIGTAFVIVLLWAGSAEADCKKCKTYFDYQALTYCKYCIDSACGGFSCTIRDMGGWQDCDLGDDESCFTYYGVDKGYCGPREQQELELRPPVPDRKEWRLIRVRTFVVERG